MTSSSKGPVFSSLGLGTSGFYTIRTSLAHRPQKREHKERRRRCACEKRAEVEARLKRQNGRRCDVTTERFRFVVPLRDLFLKGVAPVRLRSARQKCWRLSDERAHALGERVPCFPFGRRFRGRKLPRIGASLQGFRHGVSVGMDVALQRSDVRRHHYDSTDVV